MYNANNYGYNPYAYIPPRPMPQPIQNTDNSLQNTENLQRNLQYNANFSRAILNGKQVESIDVAKMIDIPLDGSVSYFPLADNSAIVTKQLQMDGKSKVMIYKPVIGEEKEMPKYLTKSDLEAFIGDLGINTLDDIKDDIESLKAQIKEIKNNRKTKVE